MVRLPSKAGLLLIILCVAFVEPTSAQYENYSFRGFPGEELVPLAAAYGLALDFYAAGNWTESIRHLESSLRLRRLLRDSARVCGVLCSGREHEEEPPSSAVAPDVRALWHLLRTASCQRRCRAQLPALQLPAPGRQLLEEFSTRAPYRYLHFAHSKLNDLQSAVPCAYTFLQRNPGDQELGQLMEGYKDRYDLDGYLVDHEEQVYEAPFVRGVKLVSSGDYSSSTELLEEALRLYLQEYHLCQADCEGIGAFSPEGDFYALIAVYVDMLKCKLECEENLTPNVGGYFVENFVATIYHHLQYAYYKVNDGRRAAPCAFSYFLFEPEDRVMKQNLLYYKAYSQQWGLQPEHFTPRPEAVKHYNHTVTLKQMLKFAEMYSELDDEDIFGAEGAALLTSESPDAEFEGVGDYEESIYASSWTQTKGKGDTGESDT
uniref:Prolyl 3-hydroxylase family member 4 (inactive) n=1 Tax=Kryptolebias marmoratus TaxID=37003 RepID=A0A3Q3B519_KRYMA